MKSSKRIKVTAPLSGCTCPPSLERRRLSRLKPLPTVGLMLVFAAGLAGCKTQVPRSPDAPVHAPGSTETTARPSTQPYPQDCTDAVPLQAQIDALTQALADKDRLQQEADGRFDALRGQLDSERNERQRLERQLRALKSLEEHIKDRDASNP